MASYFDGRTAWSVVEVTCVMRDVMYSRTQAAVHRAAAEHVRSGRTQRRAEVYVHGRTATADTVDAQRCSDSTKRRLQGRSTFRRK